MYVCRYRVEKYVMNENKDKLSLMDGEQLPVCLGVVVSRYKRANNDYKDL